MVYLARVGAEDQGLCQEQRRTGQAARTIYIHGRLGKGAAAENDNGIHRAAGAQCAARVPVFVGLHRPPTHPLCPAARFITGVARVTSARGEAQWQARIDDRE